ncbi:type II toxin-antitoxin system RelE/ParE family toxin [Methylobacterium organophilum]|uniref:type II toxin-antitoxin system RelE/ParE family toxin n=1 Tax=Methylobacterium organophilum TaxID=410 RepID=UPI003083FFCE
MLLEEASADLLNIYRWVYEASRDPNVARRFLDRLPARCDRSGDAPRGGRLRDDLEPGLRLSPSNLRP